MSKDFTHVETAEVPSIELKTGGATYTLVFNLSANKRAEQAIGRDLKKPHNWQGLSSTQTATIAWCGMAKNHAEVTLEQFLDSLPPSTDTNLLWEVLIEQFYPGIVARLQAALEAQESGDVPNVDAPSEKV
jgi:hypothetical protein